MLSITYNVIPTAESEYVVEEVQVVVFDPYPYVNSLSECLRNGLQIGYYRSKCGQLCNACPMCYR